MKSLKHLYFLILLLFALNGYARAAVGVDGDKLFRDYCAACHKPGSELIGPDIRNIRDKRDMVWITSFIQHSQQLIGKNDAEAVTLFLEYKKVVMPANALDINQITAILNYADTVRSYNAFVSDTSMAGRNKLAPVKNKPGIPLITTILISIGLLFFIVILFSRFLRSKHPDRKLFSYLRSFDGFITKNISGSFYLFLVFVMIIDTGFYLNRLNYFTAQENIIKITQPIWFSHETHYTTYKIECLSCHKNALSNQMAGLPDIQSCMKCHVYIKKGAVYGQVEIVKLYKKFYAGEEIIWNEGYRLSQYVHFDHSLHTVAGKINCIDCHTNQTNIEVSKLEFKMAWCVSCHQTKKIDVGNKYYPKIYDSTFFTKNPNVALTGGIDCSKCHY